MNWLDNNPLGVALASVCGVLLLISALLVFVWSRPPPSAADEVDVEALDTGQQADLAMDLGPISDYKVVTDRPVFDETRRPVVGVDEDPLELEEDELTIAGAPEVMLTGVVMTATKSLVTLKPLKSGKSVIVHQGEPLEGEYVGWTVSQVEPRRIVLTSRDGESLELDLQINTRRIEEPPEPEPVASDAAQGGDATRTADAAWPGDAAQAGGGPGAAADADAGQPLSRAEEIRRRIAERREELRREQQAVNPRGPDTRSRYQEAIREMMNRNRDTDEDGSDRGGEDQGG